MKQRINPKREKYFWSQYGYNNPKNVPEHWSSFGVRDSNYTDEQMLFLTNRVKSVSTLTIADSLVTQDGVIAVTDLINITYLDIRNLRLNDDIIPYLKKLITLEELLISSNNISATKLIELVAGLPHLTWVLTNLPVSAKPEIEEAEKKYPNVEFNINYYNPL